MIEEEHKRQHVNREERRGVGKRQKQTLVEDKNEEGSYVRENAGIPTDEIVDDQQLTCSSCGKHGSVLLDYVHGILVCEDCGNCYMSADARKNRQENQESYGGYDLVSSIQFDQHGRPEGIVRVNQNDSGIRAGVQLMQSARARKAVQFAQPYDASIPIKKLLVSYGNGLDLPSHVVEQATLYALKLLDMVKKGSWKRELIVAVAVYIAIRMNQLPLTLLDIMSQCVHAGVNIYVVGRYYRMAVHILGVNVPVMDATILLPRMIEKVFDLSGAIVYDRGISDICNEEEDVKHRKKVVLEDATVFLRWLSRRELHAAHPHTVAGVSIVMALEMNDMYLSIDKASARALGTSLSVFRKKRRSVKQYLVSMGKQYLPFGDNIKMSNVGQYCRTIMKISNLPSLGNPQQLEQGPMLRVEHQSNGYLSHVNSHVPDALLEHWNVEETQGHDGIDERQGANKHNAIEDHEDDDDIGLEDVDEYIRSAEEVQLFKQLQDLQEAHIGSGISDS